MAISNPIYPSSSSIQDRIPPTSIAVMISCFLRISGMRIHVVRVASHDPRNLIGNWRWITASEYVDAEWLPCPCC